MSRWWVFSPNMSLLQRLVFLQALSIIVGIISFGAVFIIIFSSNYMREKQIIRKETTDVLAIKQEKWRAWKKLNLEIALADELKNIKNEHPISIIKILEYKSNYPLISSDEIILPNANSSDLKYLPYFVYAKLDNRNIGLKYLPSAPSILYFTLIALMFILIIGFSALYIKLNIFNPINELNLAFKQLKNGEELKINHIKAKGEIFQFIESVSKMYEDTKAYEKKAAIYFIAKQVAHDIRSPLTALNAALSGLHDLSEDRKNLLKEASFRITNIANNLLIKNQMVEPISRALILNLIRPLFEEKRLEYLSADHLKFNLVIGSGIENIGVNIQESEFKRVLSNLLNNAAEASSQGGLIELKITEKEDTLSIQIMDFGNGISSENLKFLMAQSRSIEEKNGSGLGLLHARLAVKRWGGVFNISSTLGKGTVVTLLLPCLKVFPQIGATNV